MYIDSYAIIVQKDMDGGDSLQREGMYAFGKWLRKKDDYTFIIEEIPEREDPKKIIEKFEVEPGIYIRHPDKAKWYSNPWTTSRDQIIPVLAYCAAYEDYDRLWRLSKASMKRFFFAQNFYENGDNKVAKGQKVPDTYLAHLNLFIRAGGYYTAPLYPLLFFFDALDTIGIIIGDFPILWSESKKRFRAKSLDDVDDNNQIIALLMSYHFKPTPISAFNRWLYTKTRNINHGNTKMGEKNTVMGSLVWYHRKEANANPEIAELYRPIILKYFPQED